MIVSIRHAVLKKLFEKGTATGISQELKNSLLLWLSVFHAAKDVHDFEIKKVSSLERKKSGCRLLVNSLGVSSFQFLDGEMRQPDYKQNAK